MVSAWRYNTAPWSSVKKHWNGSRELRHQSFIKQKGNVYDIFNEYLVLKQEFGYMLVCNEKFIFTYFFLKIYIIYVVFFQLDADYNALINEKSNIYNEWPELSKKLETLLENRIVKDKTFAKRLEEIQLHEKGDGNKIFSI